MSTPSFTVYQGKTNQFGSNRYVALPVRRELEEFLRDHDKIIVDFKNVPNALGKLFLKEGKSLLARMQFKNCSLNVQELIKFVVSDRVRDHEVMKSTATDFDFNYNTQPVH